MKNILLTGGAGYIGSHIAVELLESGSGVVIVDDLSSSSQAVIERIAKITGKRPHFFKLDIRNKKKLDKVFKDHKIDAVVHLAGYKAVGESVKKPLQYYDNNLINSISLFETMLENKVYKLVFSSSATVYGKPKRLPIDEKHPIAPTNPYGHTKAMIEQILIDLSSSDDPWQVSILRYFNPIGAHPSGQIGENPKGVPNNLLPFVSQVATKKLPRLLVHGNDYDTVDGTGVRDYIHVVDLARGHVAALKKMPANNSFAIYNLGTGKGSSVLEVIEAFEKASGVKIDYEIGPRRDGDVAECYADSSRAEKTFNWKAQLDIDHACIDLWRWENNNN